MQTTRMTSKYPWNSSGSSLCDQGQSFLRAAASELEKHRRSGRKCSGCKQSAPKTPASERGPITNFSTRSHTTDCGYRSSTAGNASTRRWEPKPSRRPVARGLGGWHALLSSHRPWLAAFRKSCTPPVRFTFFEATCPHTALSHTVGRPLLRGRQGRPLFGGGQSAALLDWSCFRAQYLGKAATWRPQVVFLPEGTCWTRP